MATTPRGIVTPEAVVLDFETAGIASRALARALDALIQGALLFALLVVTGIAVPGSAGVVVAIVGLALVVLGYPILCEVLMRGRSPGKAALGIRVVTVDGGPVSPRHAFIRSSLGVIDFLVPPGGLFAVLTSLLSSRGQRLGDLVAGTIVVRERSAAGPALAVWFSAPASLAGYAQGLDVSSLTDQQFAVIRGFLLRVQHLAPEARSALSARLAASTAAVIRQDRPAWLHPELFLVCVAAAYQRRSSAPPPPPPPPPPPLPAASRGRLQAQPVAGAPAAGDLDGAET